jgi:hypothetical protein
MKEQKRLGYSEKGWVSHSPDGQVYQPEGWIEVRI